MQEEIEKIKTGGSIWLEPFREWIGSALSCAKIARICPSVSAKNTSEEIAFFGKTVGSNFFLTNRQLSLNYNQGFAELCATHPAQRNSKVLASKSFSVGTEGFGPPTCPT